MTANPLRPARYRAGKKLSESSEEEEDEDEDDEDDEELEEQNSAPTAKQPPPKATSFPKQISVQRKQVDEKQRKLDQYEEEIRKRIEREDRERMEREAGFVTESEESEDEDEDEAEGKSIPAHAEPPGARNSQKSPPADEVEKASSSLSEEESGDESASESSEDDQPKLLRPIFTKQSTRTNPPAIDTLYVTSTDTTDIARRKAATDALLQDLGDARAAEKAARSRAWDDDETGVLDEEAIDDRDGLNPELEHQQWIARELARLKRDRAALEEREAEIAEVERRRNLSTPEREAEDREVLEKQKEERETKGKMGFMQKYQHRGAFFQDDGEGAELAKRDLMGARYVDQVESKDALPEYLRRRDEKKIGKKGASKYRDMRSEDTGRFGGFLGDKRKDGNGYGGGGGGDGGGNRRDGREGTGANASRIGEKRRGEDGREERPSKKQSVLSRY
ncbi:MAG: hypothetical protein Q9162_004155 [Coniocarpon cinnabarinum]